MAPAGKGLGDSSGALPLHDDLSLPRGIFPHESTASGPSDGWSLQRSPGSNNVSVTVYRRRTGTLVADAAEEWETECSQGLKAQMCM